MGWHINVLDNTLKINKKTQKALWAENEKLKEAAMEIWWSEHDIVDRDGHITFCSDHMEHMDFFRNGNCEEIVKVLLKNKVKGRVTFGSLDGDDSGSFWGYEFDGKGNMHNLEGELSWKKMDGGGGS